MGSGKGKQNRARAVAVQNFRVNPVRKVAIFGAGSLLYQGVDTMMGEAFTTARLVGKDPVRLRLSHRLQDDVAQAPNDYHWSGYETQFVRGHNGTWRFEIMESGYEDGRGTFGALGGGDGFWEREMDDLVNHSRDGGPLFSTLQEREFDDVAEALSAAGCLDES